MPIKEGKMDIYSLFKRTRRNYGDIDMRRVSTPIPHSFWYCAGLVALFNLFFVAWMILKPGTHQFFVAVDEIGQLVSWSLGAVFCFGAIKRSGQRGRSYPSSLALPARIFQCWIPLLFGLGECCAAIGQAFYTYYDLHQIAPFPSWADVGFLSAYPFLLLGILILPTRQQSGAMRMRILLDGVMILTAIITFSWYFTLGPTLLQGNETLFAKAVGTTYPISDLILLCCVLFLWFRSIDPSLRPALRLLSLSLIIIVITDSIYAYQTLQGTYTPPGWVDSGWPLGYLLLALAIQMLSLSQRHPTEADGSTLQKTSSLDLSSTWRTVLPYILVPAVLLLAVYVWRTGSQGILVQGVYSGVAILLALIFARQLLAMREIHFLNHAFHASNTALQTTQLALHQKNEALDTANRRLEALAATDPLTELPNHRALVSLLDSELERAQRYRRSCTLLFLDIDHFKALNDGYGHSAGDAVLHAFSRVVRSTIRGIDTLGRWGGEEFVVILPELTDDEAMEVAESIRTTVAAHPFSIGGGICLTCSIGLATFPIHAELRETLVNVADHAMYGAKRLGRNQVRNAQDPAVLALLLEDAAEGGREDAANAGTVDALMHLLEAHNAATFTHARQVAELLPGLARSLGLDPSEAQMVAMAGQLHDIGKIAIPSTLLQKPGPLTEEEWTSVRMHPLVGAEVVSRIPALRSLAPVIRAHHERWDGQGYPDHLAAEAIPFGARMLAVVNTYMAMTTDRPYQKACDHATALTEIRRCAGSQFDPQMVDALSARLQTHQHAKELTGMR